MEQCSSCTNIFANSNVTAENINGADEIVVQIHEEPNHRHVLHSGSIRVFDAYFPPNKVSLYHSHEKDSVLVCLDGGEVTNELPGKALVPRPPIPTGEIYYRPYASKPLIHRIRNLSSTAFRILDIEVLTDPQSSIELPSLPNIFNIVIENDRVRVSKLSLAPYQSTGEVQYSGARLLAVTEAGEITISSESQSQVMEVARGSMDMQELPHKEVITNIGDSFVEIVLIETK